MPHAPRLLSLWPAVVIVMRGVWWIEVMTPGTIILLHSPLTTVAAWGELPGALRSLGCRVVVPEITDDDRAPYAGRYVARAALEIAAAEPVAPLVLVAHGAAGPLLPPLGGAQRAVHRLVGGYVFCDAQLPGPGEATRLEKSARDHPEGAAELRELLDRGGRFPDQDPPPGLAGALRPRGRGFFTEPLPSPRDWPDAPGGYLRTSAAYDHEARQARLRGWPVTDHAVGHFAGYTDPAGTADALHTLFLDM